MFEAELQELRWETLPAAELAVAIAVALRDAFGAKAVELALEDGGSESVTLVVLSGRTPKPAAITAKPPAGLAVQRRPRGGWGRRDRRSRIATRVGATRRIDVPLTGRYAEGYLVVWTSRTPSRGGLDEDGARRIAANLALVLDARALVRRVAKLSRTAHSDNRRLRQSLRQTLDEGDMPRSPAMRECLERAHAVAPHDTAVLITGPSGAGKERLARRIHARSSRADGPFVALNCGAIPESLADSALFGHERGAFTGAARVHRGVFERARGGTLLLDEVGELSPATQVKLLRVLQEGTFTPVGGEQPRVGDARVLAATHRDLAAQVTAGTFREDLYYRLAVFEVRVPGLAERPEDLPRLVRTILEQIASKMGRPVPSVPRAVMQQLAAYAWPGNIRELHNVLEGALVMSRTKTLAGPLPLPELRAHEPPPASDFVPTFEAATRAAIEAALRVSGGRIYGAGGAAGRLGLKPGTLQSKMRKLGVDRLRFVS